VKINYNLVPGGYSRNLVGNHSGSFLFIIDSYITRFINLLVLSNQIPSIPTNKNKWFILLILRGIFSSIVFRNLHIDIEMFSLTYPIRTGILCLLVVFSTTYLMYLVINVSFRLVNCIKLIPMLYKELQKDRKKYLGLVITYYLKTLFITLLSIWLVTRMVFSINDYIGIIYGYSSVVGVLLSMYFINRYSEEYKGIEFKTIKYPKVIYIFAGVLLLFYFIFVPFLFYKLITHKDLLEEVLIKYTEVEYKYKGNSMFPGNRTSVDNNVNHKVKISGVGPQSITEEVGKSVVQSSSTNTTYTGATSSYSIRNTVITDTEISMNNKPAAENALAFNFTGLDQNRTHTKNIDFWPKMVEKDTDSKNNDLDTGLKPSLNNGPETSNLKDRQSNNHIDFNYKSKLKNIILNYKPPPSLRSYPSNFCSINWAGGGEESKRAFPLGLKDKG